MSKKDPADIIHTLQSVTAAIKKDRRELANRSHARASGVQDDLVAGDKALTKAVRAITQTEKDAALEVDKAILGLAEAEDAILTPEGIDE